MKSSSLIKTSLGFIWQSIRKFSTARLAMASLGAIVPWFCQHPAWALPITLQYSTYPLSSQSSYSTGGLSITVSGGSIGDSFSYSSYEYAPGYIPNRVILWPGRHHYGPNYERSSINNSVLVNPTIVNSPIYNSTLINPTIVTSPDFSPHYPHTTVIRYAVPDGVTGITLPFPYPNIYSPPIFHY